MNLDKLDYNKLTLYLKRITTSYPFLRLFSIGKSHMQREIWCVRVGKGAKKILIISTHHALEWITSALTVGFMRDFSHSLRNNERFMEIDAYDIYCNAELFIIPMLNPDGVDIVLNSISQSHPYYEYIKNIIPIELTPTHWQANIRGVDLNHNYDCRFFEGVRLAEMCGINSPHYTRYSGECPFSEPETQAVKTLCEEVPFRFALAFHTQGQVIYPGEWKDMRYRDAAKALAQVSGYELSKPEGVASCSGFKDWAMDSMGIPSFTVEFGHGRNPLPFSQFEKLKEPCYNIIKEITKH